MTTTERLDRTIKEIEYYFKQIIADVPEPITEEVSEGIKKILARYDKDYKSLA